MHDAGRDIEGLLAGIPYKVGVRQGYLRDVPWSIDLRRVLFSIAVCLCGLCGMYISLLNGVTHALPAVGSFSHDHEHDGNPKVPRLRR